MPNLTRQERIQAEYNGLHKTFSALPPERLAAIEGLLANAAFMKVTLKDLQDEINASGTVDEYKNGSNQFGKKASAEIQAYNTTMKTYLQCMKQLNELLPKKADIPALGGFDCE